MLKYKAKILQPFYKLSVTGIKIYLLQCSQHYHSSPGTVAILLEFINGALSGVSELYQFHINYQCACMKFNLLTSVDDCLPPVELALVWQRVEVTALDVSEGRLVMKTRCGVADLVPPSLSKTILPSVFRTVGQSKTLFQCVIWWKVMSKKQGPGRFKDFSLKFQGLFSNTFKLPIPLSHIF